MKFVQVFTFAVVVVGLMFVAVNLKGEETVYERIENLEVETPVEEVPAWQKDEDAIKAARNAQEKEAAEQRAEASKIKIIELEREYKLLKPKY